MRDASLPLTSFIALWVVLVALEASATRANQQSAHRKTPTKKAAQAAESTFTKECGNGVTLRLTAPAAAQGGLLELTLPAGTPVTETKGEWAGTAIPLWTDAKNIQHGLIGVDLERAPGEYDLNVTGKVADANAGDATEFTCGATVQVRAGKFAIESLKVAPGFVELSPEDRARADKESEEIHAIFARVTPERLWSGKFLMPLTGNRSGHNFGKRRVLNGKASAPHTGLDIPAPEGTPIHAAQSGRVVLAQNLFFSGNTVIVDHGLGVYTFYGHMKSINVAEGNDVKARAVLGLVGATGRATGPHLHWSLVVDGARVNPLGILKLPPQ